MPSGNKTHAYSLSLSLTHAYTCRVCTPAVVKTEQSAHTSHQMWCSVAETHLYSSPSTEFNSSFSVNSVSNPRNIMLMLGLIIVSNVHAAPVLSLRCTYAVVGRPASLLISVDTCCRCSRTRMSRCSFRKYKVISAVLWHIHHFLYHLHIIWWNDLLI